MVLVWRIMDDLPIANLPNSPGAKHFCYTVNCRNVHRANSKSYNQFKTTSFSMVALNGEKLVIWLHEINFALYNFEMEFTSKSMQYISMTGIIP